ncbi:MAG: hypothetical protein AABX65_01225 [Nanoarchaeota archaeon]
MIKEIEVLSLAEVKGHLKEVETPLTGFIKKFIKLKGEDAVKMKNELLELGLLKLKPRDIIKIIDTLPEDKEDLNKIVTEISLDENEIQSILAVVNKYR